MASTASTRSDQQRAHAAIGCIGCPAAADVAWMGSHCPTKTRMSGGLSTAVYRPLIPPGANAAAAGPLNHCAGSRQSESQSPPNACASESARHRPPPSWTFSGGAWQKADGLALGTSGHWPVTPQMMAISPSRASRAVSEIRGSARHRRRFRRVRCQVRRPGRRRSCDCR